MEGSAAARLFLRAVDVDLWGRQELRHDIEVAYEGKISGGERKRGKEKKEERTGVGRWERRKRSQCNVRVRAKRESVIK